MERLGEDTIQIMVWKMLEKVKKFSEEASNQITKATVMYKPMKGIFIIYSSEYIPKFWELNYPALAILWILCRLCWHNGYDGVYQ